MHSIDFGHLCRLARQGRETIKELDISKKIFPRGLFSGFAVFSFGLISSFPALPNEIAMSRIAESEASLEELAEESGEPLPAKEADPAVLCGLRRDIVQAQEFSGKSDRQETEKDCAELVKEEPAAEPALAETAPNDLEITIQEIVKGYPIEVMAPAIAKYDKEVAGLIVGIAKKESSWGEHVPTKNGQDCYNYWGYKGAGSRGTGMGYGCFGTPEEAVSAIGDRLQELVHKRKGSEPSRMVVAWKCGNSCAGHSDQSVKKWVSDVQQYYSKIAYQQ